jgi:hypothetical protein
MPNVQIELKFFFGNKMKGRVVEEKEFIIFPNMNLKFILMA